ncbi:MAG: conjugal transfer protein TraG, partial [Sphingopyxis sp.]|nr:conjugal transfer protein TraG [Sphingopyxis sp.]
PASPRGAPGGRAQGAAAEARLSPGGGSARALGSRGWAMGRMARRSAASSFGDFGERSSFAASRSFGAAGSIIGEGTPGAPGTAALSLGRTDAARELGGLAPALRSKDLTQPGVAEAVRANATTAAIHQFAEKDALRSLGTQYFGGGQAGERAFAGFAQNLVQWKAFGDTRAYDMMFQSAQRHFERGGYSAKDAALKASGVIAEASADPTFAKLIANSYDQEQMLRNDLTGAQVQVGAMEGRRDYAGDAVAATERANVASEQAHRSGSNEGQRNAAAMLGLPLDETARRIAFINTLSGEARSSAISSLSRATGRNEAQTLKALETYNASVQLGTADGASAEAGREGTSVYARTRDSAGYDFAERSGKLDAQKEIGHGGVRGAAQIGEQRRQSDNFGFAAGASAAGVSTREAAQLDAFIQTLSRTAGNQVDMAEGGAAGIADRARNERLTRIVDNERLTRMQGLLRGHGVEMTKREIALAQNGDLNMNLSADTARQLHAAGLINDSQYGAVASGGRARLSFDQNDMLVSSSTGFSQSARSDTSSKFEAGKQAGPDTVEHMLSSGAEGQAMMANWLKGGFEMDRNGDWRLTPQVADTLQRDVQAILAQTGWSRALSRSAQDQLTMGTTVGGELGGHASSSDYASRGGGKAGPRSSTGTTGRAGGSLGYRSSDIGISSENAQATLDIMNHDVRGAIAASERAAARSATPEKTFSEELGRRVLGPDGLRNRYLGEADSARGTADVTGPLTSIEQSSILSKGRFSNDLSNGPFDGDSDFKKR